MSALVDFKYNTRKVVNTYIGAVIKMLVIYALLVFYLRISVFIFLIK